MLKFSVIIPSYNHAPFLKQRIDSILSQSYPPSEIIILDDCSTDNSREIIKTFSTNTSISKILFSEKNSGSPFKQWKKGIELATNDWIWIAETDDVSSPDFLLQAANMLSQNSNAGMYYCNSEIDLPNKARQTTATLNNELLGIYKWNKNYFQNGSQEINEALQFACTINNVSAVVFNKEKLIGRTDQLSKFRYYGDWYCYIQLLLHSNIIYNKEIHNTFRRTDISHSMLMTNKQRVKLKTECFRIMIILLRTPGINRKEVISRFINKFIGFGIKADGFFNILKTIVQYYSINFKLATIVLYKILFFKIAAGKKR